MHGVFLPLSLFPSFFPFFLHDAPAAAAAAAADNVSRLHVQRAKDSTVGVPLKRPERDRADQSTPENYYDYTGELRVLVTGGREIVQAIDTLPRTVH